MTGKAELSSLVELLHGDVATLREIADDIGVKARQLAGLVADLPDPDPEPTPDPDPDPEPVPGGVEPEPGEVLVRGPYLEAGQAYTGTQMGGLYRDGTGYAMRANTDGWPNYTRPQGQYDGGWCDIETTPGENDMMRLTLTREGHPYYSATTLLEQHLIFDQDTPANGVARAAFQCDFRRETSERFKTLKLGGLVGFDGDWTQWPGGGSHGPANFSVRAVLNDVRNIGPHLGLYLYLGQSGQDLTVTGPEGGEITFYWSNDDHSVEILNLGSQAIEPYTRYSARVEADVPAGKCRLLLYSHDTDEWVEIMGVEGFTWAPQGRKVFNRGYPVVMYGGRDESFAPQNPEQTGRLDYGRIRFEELA